MTDKPQGRELDDVDSATLNYAEIKMLATGDPRIKEHLELTLDVQKLKMLRGEHTKQQIELRKKLLNEYPRMLETSKRFKEIFKRETEYAKQQKPFNEDNPFVIVISNKTFTGKEKASNEIMYATSYIGENEVEIGEYRGFKLFAEYSKARDQMELKLKHEGTVTCPMGVGIGKFKRLDNLISDGFKNSYDEYQKRVAQIESNIKNAEKIVSTPFSKEEEYQAKTKKLNKLTLALGIGKSDNEGRTIDDSDDNTKSR